MNTSPTEPPSRGGIPLDSASTEQGPCPAAQLENCGGALQWTVLHFVSRVSVGREGDTFPKDARNENESGRISINDTVVGATASG